MNTSSPPAKRRRAPVTALIIALIFALAAPSLGFSALLLLQTDNVSRRAMTTSAAQGVDGIADTLDRELRSMSTNLALLASSGWLETQQYDLLHARATEALQGTNTYLVAVDADHQQVLNTRVQFGAPLGLVSDIKSIDDAIAKSQPVVSDLFFGRIAQKNVFNVVMPLISGQTRVKALILTRDADKLGSIFQERLPPTGWTYAILDRAGGLVAGDPPDAGPDLLAYLCRTDRLGLHQSTAAGVNLSATSQKLEPWGWTACVWTSSDPTSSAITQRWRMFTIISLGIVAAALFAGAVLGQMLAGAIRRAATVGRVLDAGSSVPETRSFVREVDDVLATLNRAARRRLQHEEEQTVLLRETAHRAKNQLAIASALARLSARSAASVDELRDDIVARLSALGRSIDTMSQTPSGNVSLKALATAQLEPFAADHPGRLDVANADVWVTPTTAQSLGLVLHELATNAAKYGAWSAPEGRVSIDWRENGDGLTLTWSEHGGPKAAPPSNAGFGSSLIEMMIERSLGGSVAREYRDTGLVATFRLPPRPLTV
jgi:two-component sensor histidine kinase